MFKYIHMIQLIFDEDYTNGSISDFLGESLFHGIIYYNCNIDTNNISTLIYNCLLPNINNLNACCKNKIDEFVNTNSSLINCPIFNNFEYYDNFYHYNNNNNSYCDINDIILLGCNGFIDNTIEQYNCIINNYNKYKFIKFK